MNELAFKEFFDENGYAAVPGVFSQEEVDRFIEHFMGLRSKASYGGDMVGDSSIANDPLARYPRMVHMHRWDEISLRWVLDPRLAHWLTLFMNGEPFAAQTMLYFKPPGARGQALHQDNFYLQVSPGTCCAAWLALDDADEENGCLHVVPGSHKWELLCPTAADAKQSFTDVTVPLPEGIRTVAAPIKAGDVLFFHGSLVHGSYPNRTPDRFRRALIGHYADGRALEMTQWCRPVLRMDGTPVDLDLSPGGGPCGAWVDVSGQPEIKLTGKFGELSKETFDKQ